jgi:hypothetical protein
MKNLLTVFVILLLSFVIGCGKSDKTDSKTEKKSDVKKDFVSGFACKIDGKDFYLPDSLTYARKDDKSFTIYAKIDIDNGQYDDFFFYINTPIKVGEFALSKDNNPGHVQYNTNKEKASKGAAGYDAFWSDNGKLVITKMDDKGIEGNFNFSASGTVNDIEKKINITEGKIKIVIN